MRAANVKMLMEMNGLLNCFLSYVGYSYNPQILVVVMVVMPRR
jgi:hypothetical protein